MNTFSKILLAVTAFVIFNLVFKGIQITFNGIPFGIITLIFGVGLFAGLSIKK